MDITQIDNLGAWILGFFITSGTTLVLSIISIFRAGKLLPKELKGADLENKTKEVDLALKMEQTADRAVAKSDAMRVRLDAIEDKYCVLEDKVEAQERLINSQVIRITAQEIEIANLMCELQNYKIYTNSLIMQLREVNVIPLEMESVDGIKDCEDIPPPKKVKRNK